MNEGMINGMILIVGIICGVTLACLMNLCVTCHKKFQTDGVECGVCNKK